MRIALPDPSLPQSALSEPLIVSTPEATLSLSAIVSNWGSNMTTDLTRYAVFAIAVWLVVWVLLGGVLAGRKIRPDRPPARQLALEFLISLRSIAIFSTIGVSLFVLGRLDLLAGPDIAADLSSASRGAWFAVTLIAIIIGHDAYFYWAHRIMHRPGLFKVFHRRHHRSHNPSPFTAYSFDLAEAAVMASFVPLWMLLVPTQWEVVGLFMLHQIVRNTMGHCGYELFPARANGRPLLDWLTTVTHHDLHHAQAGYNYGLYFTWWDRLMGTEHPQYYARFADAVRKGSSSAQASGDGAAAPAGQRVQIASTLQV